MRVHFRMIASVLAIVLLLYAGPIRASETYTVDTDHTYILFKVKHFGIGYSYGRFDRPTGTVVWEEDNLDKSSIHVMVNAADVNTANDKRDQHLRTADFFNTNKYTTIEFKSSAIKKLEDDQYMITGDITLLGKTRPITIEARQTGMGKDPWGSYRRGFETRFVIKRSDWGMDYMLGGVSDDVELTVSIEGIRQ